MPKAKNTLASQKSTACTNSGTEARFPMVRMRRNRSSGSVRRLVAENHLTPNDLILPIFVIDGENRCEPIASMPGIDRLSIDLVPQCAEAAFKLGIPAVALFPCTAQELKTADGREAFNPNNLICRAIRSIKKNTPDLLIICDVALDPYTTHGQDGLIDGEVVLNDETLEVLAKQAITQADAGCDTIAPSDMMDGRVCVIRKALDSDGFKQVRIMSYSAKYASAFYGPFRDAIGSQITLKGDKKTYQMDPANSEEALRETALDVAEGADMLLIKPGMPYLDIVHQIKNTFHMPTFVYQVSGEYAMLKAAAQNGWIDHDTAMLEALLSFKRAGADGVISYYALEAAALLDRNLT